MSVVSTSAADGWFFVYENRSLAIAPVISRVVVWATYEDGTVEGLLAEQGSYSDDVSEYNHRLIHPPKSANGVYMHWDELNESLREVALEQSRPGFIEKYIKNMGQLFGMAYIFEPYDPLGRFLKNQGTSGIITNHADCKVMRLGIAAPSFIQTRRLVIDAIPNEVVMLIIVSILTAIAAIVAYLNLQAHKRDREEKNRPELILPRDAGLRNHDRL